MFFKSIDDLSKESILIILSSLLGAIIIALFRSKNQIGLMFLFAAKWILNFCCSNAFLLPHSNHEKPRNIFDSLENCKFK